MMRLPTPAQYLVRVDDLCPTVDSDRWRRLSEMLGEAEIHPILAVVPENSDPELAVSAPDPNFWTEMRDWERAGATIALHGYRHTCVHAGRSLVPRHRLSEFAGVPVQQQSVWINAGLAVLRDQGLSPRLWAAPRHGLDRNTLHALREAGIGYLSDGLCRVPVRRGGVLWIPQQLWAPAIRTKGVWTICLHPNTMNDRDFFELRAFLTARRLQFTSFDRVVEEFTEAAVSPWELARESVETARLLLRSSTPGRP